jgi:hypothetical protein
MIDAWWLATTNHCVTQLANRFYDDAASLHANSPWCSIAERFAGLEIGKTIFKLPLIVGQQLRKVLVDGLDFFAVDGVFWLREYCDIVDVLPFAREHAHRIASAIRQRSMTGAILKRACRGAIREAVGYEVIGQSFKFGGWTRRGRARRRGD